MRFLYTGASAFLKPQNNPSLSLGGFMSSTVLPNGRMNSLFSDGSYFGSKYGNVETKALILENESGVAVNNLKLGYKYTGNLDFMIEVAFVTLQAPDFQQIEKIGNVREMPYYASFIEANIEGLIDNSAALGTMVPSGKLGVWIRRTQMRQSSKPCSEIQSITTDIINNVSFKLVWN